MSEKSEMVKVEFYSQKIDAILKDEKVLVRVRLICQNLEIASNNQRKKIQEHPTLSKGGTHIISPSAGGNQETFCLDLEFLPLWLMTIHPDKVKEETRELLIKYQLEAKDVLAAHFFGAKEEPKQLTPAEQLLAQAQFLVTMESRVASVERKLLEQDTRREEAQQQLLALPAPSRDVPEKPLRAHLNSKVRGHCSATGVRHEDAWRKLYREYRDIFSVDLKVRATNRKMKTLDFAEQENCLQDLYDSACRLF